MIRVGADGDGESGVPEFWERRGRIVVVGSRGRKFALER